MNQLTRERRSGSLTKLDPEFFQEAEAHVSEMEGTYRSENTQNPASPKANLLGVELAKLRGGIEELYEAREKKVVLQALRAAWDRVADRDHMLKWESDAFERIVHALRDTRRNVLKGRERRASAKPVAGNVPATDAAAGVAGGAAGSAPGQGPGAASGASPAGQGGVLPNGPPGAAAGAAASAGTPAPGAAAAPVSGAPEQAAGDGAGGPGAPPSGGQQGAASTASAGAGAPHEAPPTRAPRRVLIRVTETVDPFTASDMRTYRLREEDVVAVPSEIAKLLVKRGKAREIVPAADVAARG